MSKIMIIDDEPSTNELITVLLEMNGFHAKTYESAKKALTALKNGEKADLIILDMRMPDMSGLDFCNKLNKDKSIPPQKVVFFTASSDLDKSLLKKYNVLGFIFKPFDNKELIKQINNFLKAKD